MDQHLTYVLQDLGGYSPESFAHNSGESEKPGDRVPGRLPSWRSSGAVFTQTSDAPLAILIVMASKKEPSTDGVG
jgi:hypothetical protein